MRVKKNTVWVLSFLLIGLISTVFLSKLNFERDDFSDILVKNYNDNFSNLQLSSPSNKNWWDSSYKYRNPINITNKHNSDLPKGYSVNISVNTSNLFSNEKLRGITMNIQSGKMEVMASSAEQGEAHEIMDVDYKGDSIKVSFNSRYILDFLNAVGSEQIVMNVLDKSSKTIFKPVGEESLEYLYVVMPMTI